MYNLMTLVNTAVWHICTWEREWKPTPVFLPGEFHGQRSLQAAVHGVTKSRARLCKYLSLFLIPSVAQFPHLGNGDKSGTHLKVYLND